MVKGKEINLKCQQLYLFFKQASGTAAVWWDCSIEPILLN